VSCDASVRVACHEFCFRYSKDGREMDAEELCQFIQKEQNCKNFTVEQCNTLIETFEQSQLKDSGRISLLGRQCACCYIVSRHRATDVTRRQVVETNSLKDCYSAKVS
jgi:hypothetical protein